MTALRRLGSFPKSGVLGPPAVEFLPSLSRGRQRVATKEPDPQWVDRNAYTDRELLAAIATELNRIANALESIDARNRRPRVKRIVLKGSRGQR